MQTIEQAIQTSKNMTSPLVNEAHEFVSKIESKRNKTNPRTDPRKTGGQRQVFMLNN